jgi:serine/threonine protein kinase
MWPTARPNSSAAAAALEEAVAREAASPSEARGANFAGSVPVPEDVALAILLRATASRIDPTGALYMRLCASFQLSSTSVLEGGNGSPRLESHWSPVHRAWVDEVVSPVVDEVVSPVDSASSERRDSAASADSSSLKWGVDVPESTLLPEQLRDASLSDLLAHLQATGLSDLLRRIQQRIVASIPSVLKNQRFRPVKWKLGRALGRGAFGECRLALCEESGALFAVKTVAMKGPASAVASTVRSVMRELEVLRGVSHPHVVDMYAVSCTSTKPEVCDVEGKEGASTTAGDEDPASVRNFEVSYVPNGGGEAPGLVLNIAMEFMEGGSLAKMIEDFGPLPEPVVASYARQIVLGLEYLHALGVVHADIKPGNCLLDKNGLLKLADFGCAQRLMEHRHDRASSVRMTPNRSPSADGASQHMNGPGAQGGGARGVAVGELGLQAVFEALDDTEAADGATAAIGALVCVESGARVAKGSLLMPEGTPNYMPAEVIRYQRYSAKSDVWAVGLTILECLTGRFLSLFSPRVLACCHLL